ncbi:MAG: DUF2232 domain-containing protein [Parvibaculaceae bacterium]|nr:DUF2232 domain-containing protein [Parvibaculaceae bacterium]
MVPYWIAGIAAGILSALLFWSHASGSLLAWLLICLTPLPVFIAGLGWGAMSALIAALIGFLMLSSFESATAGLLYMMHFGLVPYWLSRQALLYRVEVPTLTPAVHSYPSENEEEEAAPVRADDQHQAPENVEWYQVGGLMGWTAIGGCLILLLTELSVILAGYDGLFIALKNTIMGILSDSTIIGADGTWFGVPVEPERLALLGMALLPAILMASWSLLTLLHMWIAQKILLRFDHTLRPMPDLQNFELPPYLLWLLLGAVALSFIPGETAFLGGALTFVLLVPSFLLGLSVIHAISRRWIDHSTLRYGALGLFYLILIVPGWLIVPIALLGIVENWAHIRRKLSTEVAS